METTKQIKEIKTKLKLLCYDVGRAMGKAAVQVIADNFDPKPTKKAAK